MLVLLTSGDTPFLSLDLTLLDTTTDKCGQLDTILLEQFVVERHHSQLDVLPCPHHIFKSGNGFVVGWGFASSAAMNILSRDVVLLTTCCDHVLWRGIDHRDHVHDIGIDDHNINHHACHHGQCTGLQICHHSKDSEPLPVRVSSFPCWFIL